jgi:hypothetical protein
MAGLTFGGFWSSLRDVNVGYVVIAAALALIAFAIYLIRVRPAGGLGDTLPSLDRLETVAMWTAAGLLVVALVAVIIELGRRGAEDATLWSTVRDLNAGYLAVLVGLVALVTGMLWLKYGHTTFASVWSNTIPSIDVLRSYALTLGVLFILAAVAISTVRFFAPFGPKGEFVSIAPFTISGSDDKQKGVALAHAFQAKLMEIKRDKEAMDDVLSRDEQDSEQAALSQDSAESESLNVYRKLDLELKFQGVDVGGLLNWAFDSFVSRRAMQIAIAEQGDRAVVSGSLRADGTSHVYANVENKNDRIVAAVAYSKLRENLVAQQSEFQGLEWDDIEKLHRTIVAVIRLRSRSQTKMKDYEQHFQVMSDLIAKAPQLESLLRLGSEVAMKAGEIDSALAYLDRSNESLLALRDRLEGARPIAPEKPDSDEEGDEAKSADTEQFRRLQRTFVNRYNLSLIQRQRIWSSCALPLVERLNARQAPEDVFADALASHKALLKIGPWVKKRPVKLAVIGGVPQRERTGYAYKLLGAWTPGRTGLDNFADTLGLIVSTLAPLADIVFVPLGPNSRTRGLSLLADEEEIVAALETAVAEGANIVLVPFAVRPPSAWSTRAEAIKKHAGKVLIVSPAPSKSLQRRGSVSQPSLLDALFVGSVDVDGRFKGATLVARGDKEELTSYPGAIWAPGTRIPRFMSDGTWQTTYGSPYAVATAAAVTANLFTATENATVGQIAAAVRKSVQVLDRHDAAIGVVDQQAALQLLSVPVTPESASAPAKGFCSGNAS